MSPRVTSDLLLVGSVPATSTADALRAGHRDVVRAVRRR